MARTKLPDKARVPIGLKVSEADATQIDQVLTRPEFAGWTRAEWCLEMIQTALGYYTRPRPAAGADGERTPAAEPAPAEPEPATDEPEPAADKPEPEPTDQPACSHPADARDYQTGTCAVCGAIPWD